MHLLNVIACKFLLMVCDREAVIIKGQLARSEWRWSRVVPYYYAYDRSCMCIPLGVYRGRDPVMKQFHHRLWFHL